MSLAVVNHPEIVDQLVEGYEGLLIDAGPGKDRPMCSAPLEDWFTVAAANSTGSSNYPGGEIPFVSSGDSYNSITELVQPPEEEIYETPCISVTGFGQACIQPWRFCARGNGGSAVRILTPLFSMTLPELLWFVGQINAQRWRFHYGRMAIISRLKKLMVEPPPPNLPPEPNLVERLRKFRKSVSAFGLDAASRGSVDDVDPELEKRFSALTKEWKAKRGHFSSIVKLCSHPAYQQIVGMGEKAVPLLLRELERAPDHWFWALKVITGVNPVPQESRANVREMAHHWIKWGREHGYR